MKKINWLGLVNVYVFQWLFFRLTKHMILKEGKYYVDHYSIQTLILPLSGWWNEFVYLRPVKYHSLQNIKTRSKFICIPVLLYFALIMISILIKYYFLISPHILLIALIFILFLIICINTIVLIYTDLDIKFKLE